jgi:hypothetical protein
MHLITCITTCKQTFEESLNTKAYPLFFLFSFFFFFFSPEDGGKKNPNKIKILKEVSIERIVVDFLSQETRAIYPIARVFFRKRFLPFF